MANCKTLGTLGSAVSGSNTALTPNGTWVAVTSATVTVAAGRRILLTWEMTFEQQANQAIGSEGYSRITESGSAIAGTTMGVIFGTTQDHSCSLLSFIVLTPTTGSHTYQLEAQIAFNSATGICDAGALLLVEDIGT